jgi:predicted kinase
MKTLILTVGLPRTGKSTWAKATGKVMVNPDSIRLALHGQQFAYLAEPFVWAIAKVMVRALFLAGHDEVILDATNITKDRRKQWRSRNWTRKYVTFEAAKEDRVMRASASSQSGEEFEDLIAAMERMEELFEPVEEDEWEDGA